MTEFCTYTTDTNSDPVAVTREEYEAQGGLPDDWDNYIWQDARSKAHAIRMHDHRLDVWMMEQEEWPFDGESPLRAWITVAVPIGLFVWACIYVAIRLLRGLL